MKQVSLRTVFASAIIPVGILVAMLFVQDQRQGWPFSQQSAQGPIVTHSESSTPAGNLPNSALARVPVELPAIQVEMLGMQFEAVEVRTINDPVHAVATVVADESRIVHVHTRVAGWLEELQVNTTGQQVVAGQALGGVFSQELYSSQSEYLSAWRLAGSGPASAVLEAAHRRLKVFGMSDADIARIEQTGEVRRLVTITAPASGIVLNRGVSQGTAVDPSTEILTLADLSQVWVIAEVAEADAAQVKVGTAATLNFPNSSREPFAASVQFVYPTLTERTRTVRVRMTVPNTDGQLRPGMYGSAMFPITARDALTVGRDAVVDTGETQHVFIHTQGNLFEPRQVKVGARLKDRVEILEGLLPGEHVVISGVFLIDSESRLRASGSTGHAGHASTPDPTQNETNQSIEPARHQH